MPNCRSRRTLIAVYGVAVVGIMLGSDSWIATGSADEPDGVRTTPIAGERAASGSASEARAFDTTLAPLLARRCLGCHNASDRKGGLDLTTRATTLAGGDSEEELSPSNPDDNLLWQRIRDDEMPPKQRLTDDEKAQFRGWVEQGLPWGTSPIDIFEFTSNGRAGYDWWALQPVIRPDVPTVSDMSTGRPYAHPIDRFIVARLHENKLEPSKAADRRTLFRRLSFDLLGLPARPEDVDAFVNDNSPNAYEALVERMLASPHYGVRWSRHWLDIVRFGESQGFERDKSRANSWRYRDWVVEAFNRDMPYDEFARLQLAGDVLRPEDPSAVIATGMLVAGPYDEVGQSQQSEAMKRVVRQDELEDIVGTVGQTFLGLTVHCARCHDHKFDPVRQAEYYRMTAALGGVRHGERPIEGGELKVQAELAIEQIGADIAHLRTRLNVIENDVRERILAQRAERPTEPTRVPQPIAEWRFDDNIVDTISGSPGMLHGGAKSIDGRLVVDGKAAYAASAPLTHDVREKTLEAWVQLDNFEQRGGGVVSLQTLDGNTFDSIVFGEREPRQWMAGSNSFVRTQGFGGPQENEAQEALVHVAITYGADGTITGYRNGRQYGSSYSSSGPLLFKAGAAQVVFGLRHGVPGGNRMLAGQIDKACLYDVALTSRQVAASAGLDGDFVDMQEITEALSSEEKTLRHDLQFEIGQLQSLQERWRTMRVYAVTPRQPEVTHLLIRGNTTQPGVPVSAGGVQAVQGVNAEFGLAVDAPEAEGRKRLAEWITDAKNPLFARVMVNRLWHYHFGIGLVDTPSDFGFNGGRPSHPQLLDWLAAEFVESGFSIKHMHRLLVTSAAYRQRSFSNESALAVDADNRLLWRKSPLRLDAETVRDSMLHIAGRLNGSIAGPGFEDFRTDTSNSQFYVALDPVGDSFNRRSVYRTWIRSSRSRFLDVFDCPDPSTTTPRRPVTTTPLQALTLMNHSFGLRMSAHLAERVQAEVEGGIPDRVARSYRLVYSRRPDADERSAAVEFVAEHGLAALARVLFNSNEFLYVD